MPFYDPEYVDPSTWTPGVPLIGYRQFAFGTYLFPLTFQEKSRDIKLGVDQKRVPMLIGDHIPPATNVKAREINLTGTVGSGMIGISGTVLQTADDLETERAALAALQNQGRSSLFTRYDRYQNAYLTEFSFNPQQDGGAFRYADYDLKFIADDPRYYGITATSYGPVNIESTLDPYIVTATHQGNTLSFPVFTFTGLSAPNVVCGIGPYVECTYGGEHIIVTFSQLSLKGGDTLVVTCDPRPEYRSRGAVYTPSGALPQNGMIYIQPSDFQNNLDFRYFFPFISPGAEPTTLQAGCVGGDPNVNFSVSISYLNTWL
jgi:hypothetical protein